MNDASRLEIDRQVDSVRLLLRAENLQIDGDIMAITSDTWAIHGVIPVDGEVIVAEFDTYATARVVLDTVLGDPPLPPFTLER